MPKYFFTARSQKGEPHSGVQEAKDKYDLARILRQEGYVLISAVAEDIVRDRPFKWGLSLLIWNKVSLKEKMMLTRSLKVMISAGVSLPKALKTLALQAKSKNLKKALLEIVDEILKGKNFSEALGKYPDIFSELFRNMVKAGEESGALEENLGILARQMERENELKSRITSAMIYPVVIIVAMIGIGIMMLIVVVPKMAETFKELAIELPLTTRAVIFLGTFLAEKWYLVLLALVALVFFFQISLKTKEGKKTASALVLRIPAISPIVKKNNSAYTVRTLSSLIEAGIPLVRSLEIVSETLGNFYYQQALKEAIGKVKRGGKLSEALKPYRDLFPLTVVQMIEVGEETGETVAVLDKLGDFFEEEVTAATKNLATVIEPVLMLLIGGAVGFFAISMVQPMYSMLSGIK